MTELPSNKQGRIKLCPNCGANVPSFVTECPECMHEFRESGAVSSMTQLFNKLDKIDTSTNYDEDEKVKRKYELISNYPIPNDREDLLEFISVAEANAVPANGIFSTKKSRRIYGLIFCIMIYAIIVIILKFTNTTHNQIENLSYTIIFPVILGVWFLGFSSLFTFRDTDDAEVAKAWELKLKAAYNKIKIISVGNPQIAGQASLVLANYKSRQITRLLVNVLLIISLILCVIFSILIPSKGEKIREQEEIVKQEEKKQEEVQKENTIHDIYSYVETGEYNNAESSLMDYFNQYDITDEDRYEIIKKIVLMMCRKGKINEAKKFIKRTSNDFPKIGSRSISYEYYKELVEEDLLMLIETY